jgi:hypothetical protein
MNFADKSACLMANNIWNERKYGLHYGIVFHGKQCNSGMGISFVICLSAVGGSYQLH